MLTLAVFLDYANINRSAADRGVRLDYGHLLEYLQSSRFLLEAFVYVPVDPRSPHARDAEVENLWENSFLVKTKMGRIAGDSYKCNMDVELAIDLVRVAHQVKPNVVIIGSGDSDMIPAVEYVRNMGIRVEAAGFPENTARDLRLKCSGFINLEEYLSELADNNVDEDAVADERPE